MARKSKSNSSGFPGSFRRTKAFFIFNLVVWGVIGGWYLFQPPVRQQEVSRLVSNLFDSRKQITALEVGWDIWQLYYSEDFVRSTTTTGDRTQIYGGAPRTLSSTGGTIRVLANTGYTVGYSDSLGDPLWAAYQVRDMDVHEAPPRPEEFHVDTRTVARIESEIYNRSGYDRGHMAPNYAIATHYGREAQEETFQMSNVCPQKHGLNAGLWKALEQRIATNYPGRFGEVWVLAGPVFGERPARLKRKVAIPEAFYMIIVDESDGRVRAESFVLPQNPVSTQLDSYLVSIDEVERRTGLDFFNELPAETQSVLEAHRVARAW
jgi:endonuclease G, mitochondrial